MHYEIRHGAADKVPLVLLHGSEQTEYTLLDFGTSVAPSSSILAPRGSVPVGAGYAFSRRFPDRTIDVPDLRLRAAELCDFVCRVVDRGEISRRPVLVGYSNGAIMAAALIHACSQMTSGAVLLRPLPPFPDREFPTLADYPVLVVDGRTDPRRAPRDATHLVEQLARAGAAVTRVSLAADHAIGDLDRVFVNAWLSALSFIREQ